MARVPENSTVRLAWKLRDMCPKFRTYPNAAESSQLVILDMNTENARVFRIDNRINLPSRNWGVEWFVQERGEEELLFETAAEVFRHFRTLALIS